MSDEMRAIVARVLYFEREKVAEADATFDLEVAAFLDRLDSRAVEGGQETA